MKHRSLVRRFLLLFSFLLTFVLPTLAAEKRSITEKDLFNFVWVGDPQVSFDGARVIIEALQDDVLVTLEERGVRRVPVREPVPVAKQVEPTTAQRIATLR